MSDRSFTALSLHAGRHVDLPLPRGKAVWAIAVVTGTGVCPDCAWTLTAGDLPLLSYPVGTKWVATRALGTECVTKGGDHAIEHTMFGHPHVTHKPCPTHRGFAASVLVETRPSTVDDRAKDEPLDSYDPTQTVATAELNGQPLYYLANWFAVARGSGGGWRPWLKSRPPGPRNGA